MNETVKISKLDKSDAHDYKCVVTGHDDGKLEQIVEVQIFSECVYVRVNMFNTFINATNGYMHAFIIKFFRPKCSIISFDVSALQVIIAIKSNVSQNIYKQINVTYTTIPSIMIFFRL